MVKDCQLNMSEVDVRILLENSVTLEKINRRVGIRGFTSFDKRGNNEKLVQKIKKFHFLKVKGRGSYPSTLPLIFDCCKSDIKC